MKKNTFIKTLGVGALAVAGLCAFTGCANTELSQDNIDDTIASIEKIETELTEQNETLTELVAETSKLTEEELLDMYYKAELEIKTNYVKDWDNMRVTIDAVDSRFSEVRSWFKLSDGKQLELDEDKEGNISSLLIENESGVSTFGVNGTKFTETTDDKIFENKTSILLNAVWIQAIGIDNMNVLEYEIDNNSNYNILIGFSGYMGEVYSNGFIKVNISSTGKLMSQEVSVIAKKCNPGDNIDFWDSEMQTTKITYEYGVLTEEEIQAKVDYVKANVATE